MISNATGHLSCTASLHSASSPLIDLALLFRSFTTCCSPKRWCNRSRLFRSGMTHAANGTNSSSRNSGDLGPMPQPEDSWCHEKKLRVAMASDIGRKLMKIEHSETLWLNLNVNNFSPTIIHASSKLTLNQIEFKRTRKWPSLGRNPPSLSFPGSILRRQGGQLWTSNRAPNRRLDPSLQPEPWHKPPLPDVGRSPSAVLRMTWEELKSMAKWSKWMALRFVNMYDTVLYDCMMIYDHLWSSLNLAPILLHVDIVHTFHIANRCPYLPENAQTTDAASNIPEKIEKRK